MLTSSMSGIKTGGWIRIARVALAVYAVSLTGVTVLAVTIGPFKDSVPLWVKVRTLETNLQESLKKQTELEEERNRLLTNVKTFHADQLTQQETRRVLQESVKNPELVQKLVEANKKIEKLNSERGILIVKIDELQKQILNSFQREKEVQR